MGLVREPGANLAMPFDCGVSAVSGEDRTGLHIWLLALCTSEFAT
jgi:hypothetical protein